MDCKGVLRVNGVLNITRSLGEVNGKPMISSKPDCGMYELTDSDYLMLLATDGVWDSDEFEKETVEISIYNMIRKFVIEHPPEGNFFFSY